MLRHFKGFGEYVEITGFSNVKIDNAESFLKAIRIEQQGAALQFFNAELVATWQHLYFAVLNALTAFRNKRNISKSVEVEVMLYASAQRQIRKAITLVGLKRESADVAVVIIGEDRDYVNITLSSVSKQIGSEPDASVLELSKNKEQRIRSAFRISESELKTVVKSGAFQQALVDLICERMALLSTQI